MFHSDSQLADPFIWQSVFTTYGSKIQQK